MSDDRAQGAGDKLVGSIKEEFGKLTGDHATQAEGFGQKAGGSVQNAAGKAEDASDLHARTGDGPSQDRVDGAGDKFAGGVKEGWGKLTGDHETQAEGAAQKTGGSIQNAIGKAEDAIKNVFKK